MHWKIKASLQKLLNLTRLGDQLNHIPATLQKEYHKNVCLYQFYECIRKFELAQITLSSETQKKALEIGTGYSLIAPITLFLLGFDQIVTVDISNDVSIKGLQKQINYLFQEDVKNNILEKSKFESAELEEKMNRIQSCKTLEDLFTFCNIIYIPNYTFAAIENTSSSYHYIYSQVVFEHISPEVLQQLFVKMKQWLHTDGCAVHTINFIDHFANPGFFQDKKISEFNFLKYSNKTWDFWAGNAIAYTNRLSYLYYLELCKQNELNVIDFIGENYRDHHPLPENMIHPDVLHKYATPPSASDLCKYQRGTLLFKK